MGQILHGSATTTEAVRRAIQHSQESLRGLAKRYGINQKTVAKWKQRSSVSVKKGKTPVLTPAEAHQLLDSIDISMPAGLRDRASHRPPPRPMLGR